MIRILQVIGSMNRGGAEAMVMNLYRNIDREHIQFDFIENTMERAAFDDEIESLGGRIYNCPHYTGKNHLQYVAWWKQFFADHAGEYEIIHGHIGSTAAIYLSIARKNGLFTIAHSHNSGTDHSLRSLLYAYMSYPTRFIADYFFACSEAAGRDRYGIRVLQSQVYRMLPNAIDVAEYRYDECIRNDMRAELGLNSKKVIGHVGRFSTQKNHLLLLAVFAEIQKIDQDTVLLLVGDGELREQVELEADRLGILEHIVFTGVRSDVNRIIQAMDVFVFPSLYEGLPVTLVEAQTSGLRCLISDKVPCDSIIIPELVEVVSLSDSAEVWAQKVMSSMNYPREDRSKEMAAAGFDIKYTAKMMEEFYTNACK